MPTTTTTENSPSSSHAVILVDGEERSQNEDRSGGMAAQNTALKRPVEPDAPDG